MAKVLVTGCAGFIGYHITHKLLREGHSVFGIDNLNLYYDSKFKYGRLRMLGLILGKLPYGRTYKVSEQFTFRRENVENPKGLDKLFREHEFDYVIHLAAQVGVRNSIQKPGDYLTSNIEGFLNVLECCRRHRPKHLIFASSSSLYGINSGIPFREEQVTDHPLSFYAVTKKTNEGMAHSYSHLYDLPITGLRFFTVYGPWARPDMAGFLFTDAILNEQPIRLFNHGDMERDFTYVSDVVDGIHRVLEHIPESNTEFEAETPLPGESSAPYRIFNIGNGKPIALRDFVGEIEKATGKKAIIQEEAMQDGDMKTTFASTEKLREAVGYEPKVSLELGVSNMVAWYNNFMEDEE